MNKKNILIFLFAVLFHLTGYYILIKKIEPFQYFAYLILWWSYILLIDTLFAIRSKRFLIFNRNLPFLIVISSGFWCMYEIINLRLENWFYINLPRNFFQRWVGYMLAYGTVIPALYVTKDFLQNLLGEMKVKPLSARSYSISATYVGAATLIVTIAFPDYFFPLAWIFLVMIMDGYNYQRGYSSFMGEKEQGLAGNIIATLLSGLICGVLWETWNFWSISKWVYTVPFFENLKIFEMPLPGYLGFLFFAMGTIAFVNFLQGIKVYKSYLLRATAVALIFSLFSFAMIDRNTVFSNTARIDQLSFIAKARFNALRAAGVKTSFGIDPAVLEQKEKATLDMIHLKGLGYDNYLKLQAKGIDTIQKLSQSDEDTISRILNEPNLRRIRVYLKAARQAHSSQQIVSPAI